MSKVFWCSAGSFFFSRRNAVWIPGVRDMKTRNQRLVCQYTCRGSFRWGGSHAATPAARRKSRWCYTPSTTASHTLKPRSRSPIRLPKSARCCSSTGSGTSWCLRRPRSAGELFASLSPDIEVLSHMSMHGGTGYSIREESCADEFCKNLSAQTPRPRHTACPRRPGGGTCAAYRPPWRSASRPARRCSSTRAL